MITNFFAAVTLSALAVPLVAQERPPWFVGAGIGPLRQDRNGNDLLRQGGSFYQAHGGWRWSPHLGARLDLVRASVAHNDDVIFAPCPEPPASCPSYFLGPVRLTGITAGVEASWINQRILILGTLGPGAYWLDERPPGTRRPAAGMRIGFGGGYRLADRVWAVLDLHYHRLFTDGASPRWLMPGSIGFEVR
jgi:outer membrane protein with beta-barrel domain